MDKDLFTNFPESLRAKRQWIVWKREPKEDGKWTKTPYQTNGKRAATTRPEEWTSFEDSVAKVDSFDGIGYVFYGGEVGIDLDHCIDEKGNLADWAREVLNRFDSYTERSPSGDGLHLIIESDVVLKGKKLSTVECYTQGRFFTVTGDVFEGRSEMRDCDILEWHRETFPEEKKPVTIPIVPSNLPDDERIIYVMLRSLKGDKLKKLYQEGKWQEEGYQSRSQADLALVGALMFFCANDKTTADRLFRQSDLMRDKWDEQHGANTYGEMTLHKAIQQEVFKWRGPTGFIMSGGKVPVPLLILENIVRAFDMDVSLSSRFRLNDFSHMVEVQRGSHWLNMQDHDVLEAQRHISTHFDCFAKVAKLMIQDAILCVANRNKVNPQLEYFNALVWDKVPRVDEWLSRAFGTPQDDLHRAMGSNWLKGLVKRVVQPGCVFDEVLVLEGKQGMRKSTAMRVIGQPWHTESTLSTDDKDFYMLLARNVIVEFSEGEIVGRTSAQKLKAIITKTEDTFRPPYEHGMMTFKRSCVFAMTTNNSDYQKDETGGRRWLPVVLRKVADTDWLAANRDQLFAEALYRVRELRETTHEYPQEALRAIQEDKMEEDAYDEALRDWYEALPESIKKEGITLLDVYEGVFMSGIENPRPMDVAMGWRVGRLLKRVLKMESKTVRAGDKVVRRWIT